MIRKVRGFVAAAGGLTCDSVGRDFVSVTVIGEMVDGGGGVVVMVALDCRGVAVCPKWWCGTRTGVWVVAGRGGSKRMVQAGWCLVGASGDVSVIWCGFHTDIE